MGKSIKRVGDWVETEAVIAINSSVVQAKKGDVFMVDMAASIATDINPGDDSSVYANVIIPVTAGVAGNGLAAFPMLVLLDELCDAGAKGLWGICGHFDVSFSDDDDLSASGVAIEAAAALTVVNGKHDAEGADADDMVFGLSLEAAAASGSVGNASTKKALWWGGKPGAGYRAL